MSYIFGRFVKHTHLLGAVLIGVFISFASTGSWAIVDSDYTYYNCSGANQYYNWVTGTCTDCPSGTYGTGYSNSVTFCGYGAILCNYPRGFGLTDTGCKRNTWSGNLNATYATAAGGHIRCCTNDVSDSSCTVAAGTGMSTITGCCTNIPHGTCTITGSGTSNAKGSVKCDAGYYLGAYGGCWPITSHPQYSDGLVDVYTNPSNGNPINGSPFMCNYAKYYRAVTHENADSAYHGWHCEECVDGINSVENDHGVPLCGGVWPATTGEKADSRLNNIRWQECRIQYRPSYEWFENDDGEDTSGCNRPSTGYFQMRYRLNGASSNLQTTPSTNTTIGPRTTGMYNYGQHLVGNTCHDYMGDLDDVFMLDPSFDQNSSYMYPAAGHESSDSTYSTYADPVHLGNAVADYNDGLSNGVVLCPKCPSNHYSQGSTTSMASCSSIPQNAHTNSDQSGFVCDSGYFYGIGARIISGSSTCVECPYWGGNGGPITDAFLHGTGSGARQAASSIPERDQQTINDCYTPSGSEFTDSSGTYMAGSCYLSGASSSAEYGVSYENNSNCTSAVQNAIATLCPSVYSGSTTCTSFNTETSGSRTTISVYDNNLMDLTFFQRLYDAIRGNLDCNASVVWQD